MRRKLKAFRRLVDDGVMTMGDVNASMQSWSGYARNFSAYHTICNMQKLYNELFSVSKEARNDKN